jgi:hypothetical protein
MRKSAALLCSEHAPSSLLHGRMTPMVNRIQSLLGVQYPVVQAPMTYIARAELAAAVSEGGWWWHGHDRDRCR